MAQILSCYGSSIGWQLQLQLDPLPENLHMPQVQPKKTKTKTNKLPKPLVILWMVGWPWGGGELTAKMSRFLIVHGLPFPVILSPDSLAFLLLGDL